MTSTESSLLTPEFLKTNPQDYFRLLTFRQINPQDSRTDEEILQALHLVRQQLIECLKQSRSFQAKAERLAKRGIDYWAIADLGIVN